ncbi:hypothetical protein T07_9459, partial [Trichinella nelsoni]
LTNKTKENQFKQQLHFKVVSVGLFYLSVFCHRASVCTAAAFRVLYPLLFSNLNREAISNRN